MQTTSSSLQKQATPPNKYDTVICAITGSALIDLYEDDSEHTIASHAICPGCGLHISEAALYFPHGTDPSKWVVVYQGVECIDCHKED